MGVVYRALEVETQREVALKVLTLGDEVSRERFQREGEITAGLVHPGIVRVFSSGIAGSTPWIAYELVPQARSLGEAFQGVDTRARVELLLQAARGVAHAHERGVVHRDVKPDNVLVDAGGQVRVTDFGIARGEDRERLTVTGAMVGTPHVMSPEQVAGRATGPGADVWALGVILYLALTDGLPFEGANMLEIAAKICSPEQLVAPRRLRTGIPSALQAICLLALRQDPEERYPSAAEFADDLDAWLHGRPPNASASGWSSVAGIFPPQFALPLLVLVLVPLCALLLLAAVASRDPAASERPTPAASPSVASTPDAPSAAAEWRELIDLLPVEKPAALARFLSRHVGHTQAQALRLRLSRKPLLILKGSGIRVRGRFLRGSEVITYGAGGLASWSLGDAAPTPRVGLKVKFVGQAQVVSPHDVVFLALGQIQRLRRPKGAWERDTPLSRSQIVQDIARSPDGRYFAAGLEREIILLDAELKEVRRWPKKHAGSDGLAFDLVNQRLFAISGFRPKARDKLSGVFRGDLAAYVVPTGEHLWSRSVPPRGEFVRVSPRGGEVLVGTTRGNLILHDGEGRVLRDFEAAEMSGGKGASVTHPGAAHRGNVRAGWFYPDGERLVSVSSRLEPEGDSLEVRLWNVRSGKQEGLFKSAGRGATSIDIDLERRLLLLGTRQGVVEVWSLDALPGA
jgi:hypothetical protein